MRVLLVEDDAATATSMEYMLASEGMNVYTTDRGEETIDLARLYNYDIILLDLNLPDMSGYEVLRTIRMEKVVTPVMIVSGLAGIEDKVRGLHFGADDYLTKPFHKDELVARIHAIVRRARGYAHSLIEVGELSLDLDTHTVMIVGEEVPLSKKQYQMLELLLLRKGTIVTTEMFLDQLYGGIDEPNSNIVSVQVHNLRKRLSQVSEETANCIDNVWGRGYTFRDPSQNQPVAYAAE